MANEKFLDFLLKKLNEVYPNGESIATIAHKYKKETKIKIDYPDQKYIEERYENKYFKQIGNTFHVKITPNAKKIIDTYGSLTLYLDELNKQEQDNSAKDEELKLLQIKNAKLQNVNLRLQNKHLKRYFLYSIGGFLSGLIIANWKEILMFLKIINQE